MRVLLVAVVVLGVLAPGARAVTLVTEDGQVAQPFQQWANAAKVPTPHGTVVVDADTSLCIGQTGYHRPSCAAATDPPTIYIRHRWRMTFYHELGHVFDYTVMTDPARSAFEQIMHDERSWQSPPNSPHEQFAEAYRYCAITARVRDDGTRDGRHLGIYGRYGYAATLPQYRRICALIRRAGGWYMTPSAGSDSAESEWPAPTARR